MNKFNKNALEVQKCVEEIALKSRIISFYPEAISRKLHIQLDLTIIELNKLCDEGFLELKYEIKCLNNFDLIEIVKDYREHLGKYITCKQCGCEVEVGYSNIYPVYYISKEYREYVKKSSF